MSNNGSCSFKVAIIIIRRKGKCVKHSLLGAQVKSIRASIIATYIFAIFLYYLSLVAILASFSMKGEQKFLKREFFWVLG